MKTNIKQLEKIIKEEIEAVLEQTLPLRFPSALTGDGQNLQIIDRETTIKSIDDPAGDLKLGNWRNYLGAAYKNPNPEIYTDPKQVSKYKLVHQAAVLIDNWIKSGQEIPRDRAGDISVALGKAAAETNKVKATLDFARVLQSIQPGGMNKPNPFSTANRPGSKGLQSKSTTSVKVQPKK